MNSKKLTRFFHLLFFVFTLPSLCSAQPTNTPEMADIMRADGKIYVVVLVIVTIFVGLIFYLISLDKKISRLEKNNPIK